MYATLLYPYSTQATNRANRHELIFIDSGGFVWFLNFFSPIVMFFETVPMQIRCRYEYSGESAQFGWNRARMLASHCPELDTRWPHEYGILNFARRWPRTWSPANQQPKQLRCLQKVTRWQPNHTRRQHEDVIFYQVTYPQDTRRLHDSYTTSY